MSIRLPLLVLFSLALSATLPASATSPVRSMPKDIEYTPQERKFPVAEAQKWVTRFQSIVPKEGWKVNVNANGTVLIEREKPVRFVAVTLSKDSSALGQPISYREGTYRLALQFGPVISLEKDQELKALNQSIRAERQKLVSKYGIDTLVTSHLDRTEYTHDEEIRLSQFEEELQKLVLPELPEAFTPDCSVYIYRSWRKYEAPDNLDISINQECNQVHQKVMSFFGFYEKRTNPNNNPNEPIYGWGREY